MQFFKKYLNQAFLYYLGKEQYASIIVLLEHIRTQTLHTGTGLWICSSVTDKRKFIYRYMFERSYREFIKSGADKILSSCAWRPVPIFSLFS